MPPSPISPCSLIAAMVQGRFFEFLTECGCDLKQEDFRTFITVDHHEIANFLEEHHEDATRYFDRYRRASATHDVPAIYMDEGEYITAWMDHGVATSMRRFPDVYQAVADHVLMFYGMPRAAVKHVNPILGQPANNRENKV